MVFFVKCVYYVVYYRLKHTINGIYCCHLVIIFITTTNSANLKNSQMCGSDYLGALK